MPQGPSPAESATPAGDGPGALASRQRLQQLLLGLLVLGVGLTAWLHLASTRTAALQAAAVQLGEDADAAARMSMLALETSITGLREAATLVTARRHVSTDAALSTELSRIERMVPSLRTLLLLDARGTVIASNRHDLVGRDLSFRPYFRHALEKNDPGVTCLSAPFRTLTGVWALNLTVSLRGSSGAFDGLLTATLDPGHLRSELRALHRAGLEVTLMNGAGVVLVSQGSPAAGAGDDASDPPTNWIRGLPGIDTRAAGSEARGVETLAAPDGPRLVAFRSIGVQGIDPADDRLLLASSISQREVLAPWRAQAAYLSATLAALGMAACGGLFALQREERTSHAREQAARSAAAAADERQRRHAALQSVAARAGHLAGWWIDIPSGRCHWTEELQDLLRIDDGPPTSIDALLSALDPHGELRLAQRMQAVIAGGETLDAIFEVEGDDGSPRYLRLLAVPTRDPGGRVISVEGAAADVTASARATVALRESESLFRGVFDNAAAGIAVLAVSGQGRRSNPRFAEMLGWSPQELDALLTEQIIHPDDLAAERDDWDAMCSARIDGYTREKRMRCRDGQWRWTRVALASVRDEQGKPAHVIAVIEDIAERKAAEEARRTLEAELRESQKMEAIGTLAGGVAHDFNNVLGVMLANAESLRGAVKAEPDAQEALEQLFSAGLMGRELVERVLSFSRRQPGSAKALDLRDVARETAALLRSTAPAQIGIECQMPDGPVVVDGVVQQLQQVVLNLATNAMQAIGDAPGRIAIRVSASTGEGGTPGAARLEVADDGCGMDDQVRERMFEPFFTTKAIGKGTGLGLPVARSIVVEHGGQISAESERGRGTTIVIMLPLALGTVAVPASEAVTVPAADGRGARVFYVDDNKMMGAAARRLLERAGYRVTTFLSPASALQALSDPATEADVLVTDFSMPDLSGIELVDLLPPARRGMPTVLISGFMSEELRTEARRRGIGAIVRKEDAFSELVAAVGAAIGLAGASATRKPGAATGTQGSTSAPATTRARYG